MTDKIKIYNKEYPVKFGNGAIKRFCQIKDISNLPGFFDHLRKLDLGSLKIDAVEDIALILKCAIESGSELKGVEVSISQSMIFEWFGDDMEAMPKVIGLLHVSLPQNKKKEPREKNV